MIKNNTLVILLLLSLTGCAGSATLPEWAGSTTINDYGYKPHDPCFRCGESWIFLPNPPQHSGVQQ